MHIPRPTYVPTIHIPHPHLSGIEREDVAQVGKSTLRASWYVLTRGSALALGAVVATKVMDTMDHLNNERAE